MLKYALQLYENLSGELNRLEKNRSIKSFTPDERFGLVITAIYRLREKLSTDPFTLDEDEILFNKSVLPKFLSLYIYYAEKFDLESIELVGAPKSKQRYFSRALRKIDEFFNQHAEFFKYYRSGKTDLDKNYFLRGSSLNRTNMDPLTPVIDPSFCTIYSIRVATILAYSRLEEYIHGRVTGKTEVSVFEETNANKLEWTGPKIGLIELIYSLKEIGAFNNGKADLKRIIDYFENIFSIKLGNTSSSFQQILSRKTGYVNYIDKLRDILVKRIDHSEEKHIR